MGSSPWCGKGFFSQSPSSANSFRASVQPTCVQSHASRSVCTLKIPNTGSHTIVLDTWKYHTDWQERVVLLLQLLCLTQVRWPKFSARDKEVLKNWKRSKRGKDWLILHNTFKISYRACLLMMRNIGCNQMRQVTLIWMLQLVSDHCTFHQSEQYHTVVRMKTCGDHRRWGLEPSLLHTTVLCILPLGRVQKWQD